MRLAADHASTEAAVPPAPRTGRTVLSLRRYLLLGILLPTAVFMLVNTFSLYRQALQAVNTAYDRTLLASAKSIGELLEVEGEGPQARFHTNVPYSALEAFEADNRSRMVYRISTVQGELIAGTPDLPLWQGRLPNQGPYAALVDFYDDTLNGDAVRVAVLLQPVASRSGKGMATIQVAETLELRRTLARQILLDTLLRQSVLALVIALVVVLVVLRATRPVRELSAEVRQRAEGDLTPLAAPGLPRELRPLVEATNQVMARLQALLEHQKRFVRDASHQLRTPLAVLKVQVQSALRGDVQPHQALVEISGTVERATVLANQMLALAKVEQLRQQSDDTVCDLAGIVRAVALDLAPLVAQKDLEFDLETVSAPVRGHEWMLRELARNLLHNAIRHAPARTVLAVRIRRSSPPAAMPAAGSGHGQRMTTPAQETVFSVSDRGPGIGAELRQRLFQPFAAGQVDGSGLGLMICREIAHALGGVIALDNRMAEGRIQGLDAIVRLPLASDDALSPLETTPSSIASPAQHNGRQ